MQLGGAPTGGLVTRSKRPIGNGGELPPVLVLSFFEELEAR